MKVPQQKGIRLSTKPNVNMAVVVSTLFYGCEIWTAYRRHIKQLEQFHTRALSLMGIRWQDRVTNQEVLDRAGSSSIESMLLKAQLRRTGHVIRMSDSCIPKQLLYGELMCGSRKQGRPKLRFKDTLKSKLERSGVSPRELEASVADRSAWRSLTSRAAAAFEEDRSQRLVTARDRLNRVASASTTDYLSDTCRHLCASSFGLTSHN